MSGLRFKRLIIFSPTEELAKSIDLTPGLNVITTRRIDGNDCGKSILAKGLYHCLGADCKFDSKFNAANKVFVLTIDYGGKDFTIYRNGTFFKMFDSDLKMLWNESNRHELGMRLYDQFGIAIWLPSRSGVTEITPPAYSFASYFIDQGCYSGSEYRSFEGLGQYADYKTRLIYEFTGVYDEDYFGVAVEKEALEKEIEEVKDSIALNKTLNEHVDRELSGLGYSPDMLALDRDCNTHESDYRDLSNQLNKLRNKLYTLREQHAETAMALEGAVALGKRLDKGIDKYDGKTCPICSSRLDDSLSARISICVAHTDALFLEDELAKELRDLERSIKREEVRYKERLEELNSLKASMEVLSKSKATAVQAEGLVRLSNRFSEERGTLEVRLDKSYNGLEGVLKKLADYNESKSELNKRYCELLTNYVARLNLQSIDLSKIKTISNRVSASGSNAPLATVSWYFSILQLKDEFNSERPCLPLVLDSPLNVEADMEKYESHYEVIFKEFQYKHQMLVTGLGLAESSIVPEDANIIVLENEKYELLNSEDYKQVRDFVFSCMEQH